MLRPYPKDSWSTTVPDPTPQAPPPTTRRVRATDGTELAVREHGTPADGPTVVLVHGYPDTQAVWDHVVPLLRPGHHVVTYDVRGAGESGRPSGLGPYALEQLSDDLLAVLSATVPDGRAVHLVGHDWGALQSWESAARPASAPRVASLTVVAGPSLDLLAHTGPSGALDRLRQLARSWYVVAFHVPFAPPLLWRTVLGRTWERSFERTEGVPPPPGHPAPTITQDGVDGLALYRRNMLERLVRPRYARVDVPLVQIGITMRDAFIDPTAYDGLPGRMPELWIRRADVTHWAPLLHPALVAGWVRDAVDARERDATPPADAEVHRGSYPE
jgi:pimeloyl-ACP methyl ester carboxylesterase